MGGDRGLALALSPSDTARVPSAAAGCLASWITSQALLGD